MAGPNRVSLTPEKFSSIKEMADKNNSSGVIAAAPDIEKSTVSYVAKQVRSPPAPPKIDGRWRPRLLTARDTRSLARIVKANRFGSLEAITELVNMSRTKPVFARTIGREMVRMGYKSMKPALKPWVSDKNKGKRVQWALERRSWVAQCSFVFFTDESSFEVRRPTRARVWRLEGERYSPTCLRPSFKSGRQSVMVWGGFSGRGRTLLYRVQGSMQSDQYEELLEDLVYLHIVTDFGSPGGAWLQEDVAP